LVIFEDADKGQISLRGENINKKYNKWGKANK
jgi:hypothetical protein